MTPLVSVVVPAYRARPEHLDAALHSARAQTHEHLEVLVADDGSPDDGATCDVARAHAAEDPRVRLIAREHNVGAPENQRRLHAEARGTLVKPLLQDDLLEPACVATLLAALQDAGPDAALAFSQRRLVDGEGHALPPEPWTQALHEPAGVLDGELLADTMLCQRANLVGEMTTVLLRRDAVAPADLWTIAGHEFHAIGDVALFCRLLAGGRAAWVREELSAFRQHVEQASHRPAVVRRGFVEWPLLVLAAPALGLLVDPQRRARALQGARESATFALRSCADAPPHELARAATVAARVFDEPLPATATALATPAPTPSGLFAAVAELRSLRAVGAADRLVLGLAPQDVEAAVPTLEAALALDDLDVDLVPDATLATTAPAGWLRVAA